MKLVLWLIVHAYLRFRFEGRERLPAPPYVLCFNHLDWADPLILVALLPSPRRIYFFGPREANMRVGWKNRLMAWVGNDVPFKPDKSRMLETARRVREVLSAGYALAGAVPPGLKLPHASLATKEALALPLFAEMTEAQIDRAIAAATAGHRMAGMEPSEYGIEVGRRQLRGELTGDEAVALVLAENRRRRAARS